MTTKHQHKFSRSKLHATVETCTCGKFRHTEHNHNPVIEAQPPAAPAQVSRLDYAHEAQELRDSQVKLLELREQDARTIVHLEQERDQARAQVADLLAALREAADWLSRSTRIDDQEQAQDARAAIARAETQHFTS